MVKRFFIKTRGDIRMFIKGVNPKIGLNGFNNNNK